MRVIGTVPCEPRPVLFFFVCSGPPRAWAHWTVGTLRGSQNTALQPGHFVGIYPINVSHWKY